MATRALVLTLGLLLAACGTPQATVTPSPAASGSPAPNLGPFTCANQTGGVHNAVANLSALRIAHQPGFDRITFEFTNPQDVPADLPYAMPEYQLTQQASTHFVKDGSGEPVTLAGSAGLKVLFFGATGYGTYTGSRDLKPPVVSVTEVAQLGDFERTLTWGVGLNAQTCYRTIELQNPTRLAIDFETPQAAG